MYIIGAKEIVEKILPVVDNFERGLAQEDRKAMLLQMEWKNLQAAYTTLDDAWRETDRSSGKRIQPGFPQRSDAWRKMKRLERISWWKNSRKGYTMEIS